MAATRASLGRISPRIELMHMAVRYWSTMVVGAAAELGIADALAAGPLTSVEIAAVIGAQPGPLYRLLRGLAALDVLAEESNERFSLSPLGDLLRSDAEGSLRDVMRVAIDHHAAWGELTACVRTGENGFVRAHGKPLFEWLADRPDRAAVFDGAMAGFSSVIDQAVALAYDFGRYAKIVDVGGGSGGLLRTILERHPGPRGVVADLPAVVDRARKRVAGSEIDERIEWCAIDFFEAISDGGDLYVMKYILHDWDDVRAGDILANVRRAIGERDATLMVIERVVQPHGQPDLAALSDLNMMTVAIGSERTGDHWRALLRSRGFQVADVLPLGPQMPSLIEAVPV